jgi:polyhydroxyalkanoate synthesis regulator phasin
MVTSECEKRNQEIESRFRDAKEAKKLEGNELREEIESLQKQINNLL